MNGPRCPPRPVPCPQPPQPPCPPRAPSPPPPPSPRRMPPADSSRARDVWIPVSDGSYVTANGIIRSNFTGRISVTRDSQGRRVVKEVGTRIEKEEPKEEPALPPFTSLMRRGSRTPPPRPPPPRSGAAAAAAAGNTPPPRPPPPRWVSPLRAPRHPTRGSS